MEFPAYGDLVQTVEGLRELCPIVELLAHPAMRDRHWNLISQCTSHSFPFESPTFCLQNIVDAPILLHKESVEVS